LLFSVLFCIVPHVESTIPMMRTTEWDAGWLSGEDDMDQVEVNGLRIAYELAGEGPPLVLLHGFLSDSRTWRWQLDALSDEFTVVAWDAPGCGRSSDLPETFRLPEYADCLAAFIDEVAAIMSEFHPAGWRSMARALAEADLRDVLPRIEVPTLLLYGDADQRSPLHVADDLHAQAPGSRLVIIPGVNHLSNVEAAERFNSEVRSFLREVES
jgi:pimeloyl-ACP methyl ester carboxylesterase